MTPSTVDAMLLRLSTIPGCRCSCQWERDRPTPASMSDPAKTKTRLSDTQQTPFAEMLTIALSWTMGIQTEEPWKLPRPPEE